MNTIYTYRCTFINLFYLTVDIVRSIRKNIFLLVILYSKLNIAIPISVAGFTARLQLRHELWELAGERWLWVCLYWYVRADVRTSTQKQFRIFNFPSGWLGKNPTLCTNITGDLAVADCYRQRALCGCSGGWSERRRRKFISNVSCSCGCLSTALSKTAFWTHSN